MDDIKNEALKMHRQWKGKLVVVSKMNIETVNDLSITYTPGVAEPCKKIHEDSSTVYDYTWKGNSVAIVTDGTAVLGLGDIGPEAALPVMEGKAILFKRFANIDAIPICLDTKDPVEIVKICKCIAPGFGGINLEDISAPRCVEIERQLKKELNIPVFHDDQHGTAIVTTAALINALKLVNKRKEDITVVVNGVGAAGSSIIKMLHAFGVKEIYGFNSKGILYDDKKEHDFFYSEIIEITNQKNVNIPLTDALKEADVFIGVSVPNILTREMIQGMRRDPIIFAMANPEPEIDYYIAKEAGAKVVGTGRSDYPNQINNVLAFPGLFRGALDARASQITEEMKMAAAIGIASLVKDDELGEEYVIPSVLNPEVSKAVANEVMKIVKKGS